MPTFIAAIQLKNADGSEQLALSQELKQRMFREKKDPSDQLSIVKRFKKQSESIQDVTNELMVVVRKLKRPFSFTIIKEKP